MGLYVIGGRWDGLIGKLLPTKVAGVNTFPYGDEFHTLERNIVPVVGLRGIFDKELLPTSVVDCAGQWFDKDDSCDSLAWQYKVKKILNEAKEDTVVVAIDCHM